MCWLALFSLTPDVRMCKGQFVTLTKLILTHADHCLVYLTLHLAKFPRGATCYKRKPAFGVMLHFLVYFQAEVWVRRTQRNPKYTSILFAPGQTKDIHVTYIFFSYLAGEECHTRKKLQNQNPPQISWNNKMNVTSHRVQSTEMFSFSVIISRFWVAFWEFRPS